MTGSVHSSLDWKRKLRIGDLIGDALRTLARAPLGTLVVAMLALAFVEGMVDDLDLDPRPFSAVDVEDPDWVNAWLGAPSLALAPLLALLQASYAARAIPWSGRGRALARRL